MKSSIIEAVNMLDECVTYNVSKVSETTVIGVQCPRREIELLDIIIDELARAGFQYSDKINKLWNQNIDSYDLSRLLDRLYTLEARYKARKNL